MRFWSAAKLFNSTFHLSGPEQERQVIPLWTQLSWTLRCCDNYSEATVDQGHDQNHLKQDDQAYLEEYM